MSIRALFLASAALAAAVVLLGTGAGSAQAACLSIPAPGEVDFGNVRKDTDKVQEVFVKNGCGEKVKIESASFNGNDAMKITKEKCSGEEPNDQATCSLEFTFKPTKLQKYTATMSLTYSGPKVKKDTFMFSITGVGIRKKIFNQGGAFSASGALTTTTGTGFITTCAASGNGETVSEEGEGPSGEFTGFEFSGCTTNLSGCSVASATAQSLPWTLEAYEAPEEEATSYVEAQNLNVVTKLGSGCEAYGLPEETTTTGSVVGTFDNPSSCLEFSAAPGLVVSGVIPATLSGELCVTEPEGLELE